MRYVITSQDKTRLRQALRDKGIRVTIRRDSSKTAVRLAAPSGVQAEKAILELGVLGYRLVERTGLELTIKKDPAK